MPAAEQPRPQRIFLPDLEEGGLLPSGIEVIGRGRNGDRMFMEISGSGPDLEMVVERVFDEHFGDTNPASTGSDPGRGEMNEPLPFRRRSVGAGHTIRATPPRFALAALAKVVSFPHAPGDPGCMFPLDVEGQKLYDELSRVLFEQKRLTVLSHAELSALCGGMSAERDKISKENRPLRWPLFAS